ncbi:hypothetical protein PHBOTO_006334 [Pseudozyma hubeiensis]|nr:hypothetical protein PHBOTO_006334 [Pseudozyma hubeiensis]
MTQDFHLQSDDKVDAFAAIVEMQNLLEQLRARLPRIFDSLPINEIYLYQLFRLVCAGLAKVGEDRALTDAPSTMSYTLDGPDRAPLLEVHVQEEVNSDAIPLNKAVMYEDSCPACKEINTARKAALDAENDDAGSI